MAAPEQTVKPFGGPELSTRELRDLGCGRPLGRFTLLRRIATGGMAEVYVARAKGISGFEKKVAIKKILPQHSHNERFVDMLVDEAKITVSLTHPNIAQVYELGLDGDDEYFIVMEWVDGRPLNKLMQRVDERGLDTIPVVHATHVMAEISKGLDHAHKQKDQRGHPLSIVHRDVSPQNVLVSYQGDVKLIDFGIARAEGRAAQTSHGVIKGKLRYLAPEIAAGDEPDHRADVYCCGIVLFEMLTGEAMFAPKSDMDAIAMASEARVRSPRSRNPKVPQDLDDICMRALRRDRNDRYASAKDLHSDLRRFLNQHYPAYVGSELGDFMQGMFAQEIVAERRLDAVVERYAEHAGDDDVDEDVEDPTTVGALEPRPSTAVRRGVSVVDGAQARKPYKPIVTRLAIGGERGSPEVKLAGADGGEPMGVVLHDAGHERPPIRFESGHAKHPGTLPPIAQAETIRPPEVVALDEGAFNDGSAEPTRRASNPLVSTGAFAPPTTVGPEPRFDDPSEPPEDERAREPRTLAPQQAHLRTTSYEIPSELRGAATVAAPPPTRSARPRPRSRPPASARPAWAWPLALFALLVAGGAFVWAQSPPTPEPDAIVIPVEEARPREPMALEPIEVQLDRGDPPSTEAEGAEPGADDVAPTNATPPARKPLDDAEPRPKRDEPQDPPVPVKVGRGYLVVNARPVSTVFVDGVKKGSTPVRLTLPAGRHKVTLRSPDGETKTTVKSVTAGKTTTFVYRWPR